MATLRLATSAIAMAHQRAGHESPCREQGVRATLMCHATCELSVADNPFIGD